MAEPLVVKPGPNAERYATLKDEAVRCRKHLAAKYAKARSKEEKEAVLAETRDFLETLLPAMMRCWLGTPWDFPAGVQLHGKFIRHRSRNRLNSSHPIEEAPPNNLSHGRNCLRRLLAFPRSPAGRVACRGRAAGGETGSRCRAL